MLTGGDRYLGAVLNENSFVAVLLDFQSSLGRVEEVEQLFIIDFDVGALYNKLQVLVTFGNRLKQPFDGPRDQPLILWIVVVRALSQPIFYFHRPGLPAAGLAVREHRAVEPRDDSYMRYVLQRMMGIETSWYTLAWWVLGPNILSKANEYLVSSPPT